MRVFACSPHPALRATLSPRGRGIERQIFVTHGNSDSFALLFLSLLGRGWLAERETGEGFRIETPGHSHV